MAADVFFAIAVVALAAGAVAEFQIRVGNIRPAANGAAVIVGGFGGGHSGLIGTGGGERDYVGTLGFRCIFLLPLKQPGCIDPPGHGEYIHHIPAKE